VSDFRDDLALLEAAVRAAGPVAMRFFEGEVEHWHKSPGDPVSEADHAIDAQLQKHLTTARPDYGWLSEETEDDRRRLDCRRVWVVDPIDGTRAFLRDEPEFTICAGLVEDGRPVAAAVFNPASDELFTAVLGGGALLNGAPIRVTDRGSFEGSRLLNGPRMFQRAGLTPPPDMEFATVNSIAYRMCLVAGGRYDGCVSLNGKSDWDIAAAELIVTEAGGLVTDTAGNTFIYNRADIHHPSVIAAGAAMHALLQDLVEGLEAPGHAR
jgi:myo-inositol-1(or 4)-monophosphatase